MTFKEIIHRNESYYIRDEWLHDKKLQSELFERYDLNYSQQVCTYCKKTFRIVKSIYGPNFAGKGKNNWYLSEGGGFINLCYDEKNYKNLMCKPCFEAYKLLPIEF